MGLKTKPSKKVKKAKSAPKAEQVVPSKKHKRLVLPSGKSEKFYKQFISRERFLRNKEKDDHEMTKNKLMMSELRSSEHWKNFLALNAIIADLAITATTNPSDLQTRAEKSKDALIKFLK